MAELRYLHAASGSTSYRTVAEPIETPDLPRPDLRVLPRPTSDRGRWRKLTAFVLFVIVLGSLGAIVVARSEMAVTESTLQKLDGAIVAAQARHDALAATVASLTAPSRIVGYAESKLHMVPATGARIVTGPTLTQTQSVAAVPAAPGGAPYPAGSQVMMPSQTQSSASSGSTQGG
jgi:cell division protein FtsL